MAAIALLYFLYPCSVSSASGAGSSMLLRGLVRPLLQNAKFSCPGPVVRQREKRAFTTRHLSLRGGGGDKVVCVEIYLLHASTLRTRLSFH